MELILDIISIGFMLVGSFFVFAGAVGIYRFPDFYTRLHAAGVTDTLGADLVIVGLMFQAGASLVTVKLIFISLFIFFTSPTSTHAIANAAMTAGLKPFLSKLPGGDKDEEAKD